MKKTAIVTMVLFTKRNLVAERTVRMVSNIELCKRQHQVRDFGFTILGSGSKGNATVIHTPQGKLLLDAGFSSRELVRRMQFCGIAPEEIRAMLITHGHSDHISGCRVFSDTYGVPAYMTVQSHMELEQKKKNPEYCILIEPGNPFELYGVTIEPFTVSHDVNAVAYSFVCGERRFTYATDLGFVTSLVLSKLSHCNAIVLESNYDPRILRASDRRESLKRRIMSRQGHLSNEAALDTAVQVLEQRTKILILAHLSQECNDSAEVECRLHERMKELCREDISCRIAKQDQPLETFWIE